MIPPPLLLSTVTQPVRKGEEREKPRESELDLCSLNLEFRLYSQHCELGQMCYSSSEYIYSASNMVSAQRPKLGVRQAGIQGGHSSSPR